MVTLFKTFYFPRQRIAIKVTFVQNQLCYKIHRVQCRSTATSVNVQIKLLSFSAAKISVVLVVLFLADKGTSRIEVTIFLFSSKSAVAISNTHSFTISKSESGFWRLLKIQHARIFVVDFTFFTEHIDQQNCN